MTTIKPNAQVYQPKVKQNPDNQDDQEKLQNKHNEDYAQANNNRYAVVDDFKNKSVDVDGDGVSDISHGEYITSLMKAENPNIQVDSYDVSDDHNDSKLASAYDQIALNNYAAVNMSLSKPYSAEVFNNDGIKDVNQSNFANKKDEIYNTYKNGIPELNNVFSSMEKVTANGTPIYVAAGNDGSDTYNLFSTVPGVTSVGASVSADDDVNLQTSNYQIAPKGITAEGNQILGYSAMNSAISIYGKGSFKSEAVEDKNGNVLGYDINGDGKVDISNDKVSSGGTAKPKNNYIFGTSFASPTTMLDETNPFGQPPKQPVVIESQSQKNQTAYEEEVKNQPKNKNKDLDDDIKIDDDIDEWDAL